MWRNSRLIIHNGIHNLFLLHKILLSAFFHVDDLVEVCPLSSGTKLESLSSKLFRILEFPLGFHHTGIRFFHNPLPSVYCGSLTISLPFTWNTMGLPSSTNPRYE